MSDDPRHPSTEELNAAYPGFPAPEDWQDLPVNLTGWDATIGQLREVRDTDPDLASLLTGRATREAGLDSGAIEGLYTTDRGFTLTVAEAASAVEASAVVRAHKGATVEALYDAQVAGYEMALDLATGERPLTEVWIRQLHELIVGPQETYEVATPVGPQEHALPKGTYKQKPNHVVQADGSLFAYAPVDRVPHEMARLVDAVRSPAFARLHPVVAAAWLHYALVRIHPFADGNGRVTRAVASVPLLRAASLPLTIPADVRDRYLTSLQRADGGDPAAFVQFLASESQSAARLLLRIARDTAAGTPADARQRLQRALLSTAGVPRHHYDEVAVVLRGLAVEALRDALREAGLQGKGVTRARGESPWTTEAGWRRIVEDPPHVVDNLVAAVPAPYRVRTGVLVTVLVASEPATTGDLRVATDRWPELDEVVALDEAEPRPTANLRARLGLWAESIAIRMVDDLATMTEERRRALGY